MHNGNLPDACSSSSGFRGLIDPAIPTSASRIESAGFFPQSAMILPIDLLLKK
jgi:hypothetical protein